MWILFTLLAATMQTVRTGLQKQLKNTLSSNVITWLRAGFGLPFAFMYVLMLWMLGFSFPSVTLPILGCVVIAGTAQYLATYFLVQLFSHRNFTVSIAYAKGEALHTAVIGMLLFDEQLLVLGWVAVFLGVIGVIFLTLSGQEGGVKKLFSTQWSNSGLLLGTYSAIGFAFTALFIRQATQLMDSSFLMNAACTLFLVLLFQAVVIGLMTFLQSPQSFKPIAKELPKAWSVGATSMIGSVGWFTAFALTSPAYVKTLGQIELVMAMILTQHVFKERMGVGEIMGLVATVGSVVLLVLAV